jgi:hypothetical protein
LLVIKLKVKLPLPQSGHIKNNVTLNQEAANRAYQQTQLKMKGEMERASQQAEQGLARRLQAQGTTLAAGRSGQSIGGLLADAERVEGRDLGALGMNLAYAQQDYFFGMEKYLQSTEEVLMWLLPLETSW